MRPPFAHDAVQALEGGRVRILFKAPWRSGVAHADMTPPNQMIGVVSNQEGVIGTTVSASVNLSEPTPIDFAASEMICETAVLQTQG